MTESTSLTALKDAIAEALRLPRSAVEPYVAETSLIEEVGLDSLAFVDLTIAIEQRFGLNEFPMQEWADAEAAKESNRYTLGSLSAACRAAVTLAATSIHNHP